MPTLSIPNTFTPFSKILSADMNANFAAITTLLNTTKLDSTNVQSAGLTVDRLSGSGGTAGQFVSYNGSTVVYASNPLTSQFNVVIGSAAQVTAGTATHSTFASYTQADGGRILILPAYATSEAWTITKKLFIFGLGNTCTIDGAITLSTGSGNTKMTGFRTTNDITVNSGITGIYVDDVWLSGTHTFVDNNTTVVNYLLGMQE